MRESNSRGCLVGSGEEALKHNSVIAIFHHKSQFKIKSTDYEYEGLSAMILFRLWQPGTDFRLTTCVDQYCDKQSYLFTDTLIAI